MRKTEIHSNLSDISDSWQRIASVMEHYGFKSISNFAREIGLRRSENLYQIQKGNNGISRDLAGKIQDRFPQVSKGWLVTGEGTMIPHNAPTGAPTTPTVSVEEQSHPAIDRDADENRLPGQIIGSNW